MDTQSLGVTRGIVTSKSGARNCLAGASRNGNVPEYENAAPATSRCRRHRPLYREPSTLRRTANDIDAGTHAAMTQGPTEVIVMLLHSPPAIRDVEGTPIVLDSPADIEMPA